MAASIAISSITGTSTFQELDEDLDFLEDRSVNIFGRDEEFRLLLRSFHLVLETKCSATVVIHGKSGMGKTSLVDMLRQPVINSKGFFCAGKFFQNSAVQEPYSAIMAAFSDLCDLMMQSEGCHEGHRRSEIQRALGTDGYLLTKVISNISPFLSEEYSSVDVATESSWAKFNVACKKFLQVMSSDDHPVVLFLDDIQWMDEGSKQLVDMFLRSNPTEFPNVLFILTYREEEADHVRQILQSATDKIDILLLPLDPDTVYQIVSSTLDSSSDEVRELSELIHSRTLGNPFYVAHFLEAIEYECLLVFNTHTKLWEFDVCKIQSSMMIADDFIDLITRRIDRIQDDVKEALMIASLIGYSFSEFVLVEAAASYYLKKQVSRKNDDVESTRYSIKLQLTEAINNGFIEKTKDGYQFCHDKIQTAFQSMIRDTEEVALLHHLIGETFLSQVDDEVSIYNAAVHLNSAHGFYCSDHQLLRLVQINLDASKSCVDKSAFAAASSLLRDAIGQTTFEQRWSADFFTYTFEMTELLAKVELVIGNFESSKAAIQLALQMSKSTEMKTKSLLLEVELHMANQEMKESVSSAYRAFDALGVNIPKKVLPRHIGAKFLRIKILTWRLSDAQIQSMPQMIDKRMSTVVRLLHRVCACCFMREDQENLAVYSALRALEILLKYGLSPTASTAFAIYALIEVSAGNHSAACRWGNLAIRLLDSTNIHEARCATVAFTCSLVSFWKEPLAKLCPTVYEAATVGFNIGDIVYGTYCMSHYFSIQSFLGTSFLDLEAAIRSLIDTITELRQEAMLSWIQPIFQFVLNFLIHPTTWRSVFMLTGEAMDEEVFMNNVMKENKTALIAIVILQKASLACSFGFYQVCADLVGEVQTVGKVAQLSYGRIITLWAGAFSNFELFRKSGDRRCLRKARHFRRLLEKMVVIGSPDASTHLRAVQMYELSVKKTSDVVTLVNAYNDTLKELSKGSAIFQEGLLCEHAFIELARRGNAEYSEHYYKRAIHIYENVICSDAKFQHLLEQRYAVLSGINGDDDDNNIARVGTSIMVECQHDI